MSTTLGITDRLKQKAADNLRGRISAMTTDFRNALTDAVGDFIQIEVRDGDKAATVSVRPWQTMEALETALFNARIGAEEEKFISEFLVRLGDMSRTISQLKKKPANHP
jgi:hypothetical protein